MAGSHSVSDLRQLVILHPQSHTQFKTQNQGMGVAHSGLGLPISGNSQDSLLETCPQANMMHIIPHYDSAQVILGCTKLTVNANQHILYL